MYALYVTPRARKGLAKVEKHYQKKIATALLLIRQDPYSGKKLTGEFKGHYAISRRAVITRDGHRQGIYK